MHRRLIIVMLCIIASAAVLLVAPATQTPTRAQDTSHHVGFVPPGFTSPFHVAMADGAKAEAKTLNWTLDVQAPQSEGDFAGQVDLVNKMLNNGIEAVSIAPIQDQAIVASVKLANQKKIPIFMHNFITPLPDGNVTAYIGYDQWGGAEKLGIYTCQLLAKKYSTTADKAKGKVFILLGIESVDARRRTQGYKAGLATCPAAKIVGEQAADWLRDKGKAVATDALQKFPDIDVFYGNSDEMAIGAGQAAEALGLTINKDIFTISIDGNQPTLDLIKQGKHTASLGVDPNRMGQTVIDTMQQVLDGKTVPQYILTPSVVVDLSNLDDYIAGKLWTAPIAGAPELDNNKPTIDKSAATMQATMSATASQ